MNRSFILLKAIAGIGLLSLLFVFSDSDFTGRLLILWALLTLPLIWVVVAPQKLMSTALGAAIGSGASNLVLSLLLYLSLTVSSGGKWNDYKLPYALIQVPLLAVGFVMLISNGVGLKLLTAVGTALATFLYLHIVSASAIRSA